MNEFEKQIDRQWSTNDHLLTRWSTTPHPVEAIFATYSRTIQISSAMAQGYKLVEKKNLGRDAAEQPTKVYAIPKYNGYTDMDTRHQQDTS